MSEENEIDYSGLSFADDLVEASEAKVSYIKVLAYGPSGGGKTSLMSTMPGPVLVLLTEKQGEMSIRRVNPQAKIRYIEDKIRCKCHGKLAAKCPDGAPKGTEKVRAADDLYATLDELATKKHPFVSVVLDSLTDLQQVLLSDMKGGKPGAQISLPEWGKLIDRTKDLVIRLRNLNMHVGIICLSDEVQDNNSRMIYRPSLAGKKLPGNVIQYFNLCCFVRKVREPSAVGGAIHQAVFDAGDEYYTKGHPALEAVEVPNVRAWVEKIAAYAIEHNEGDMPSHSAPVAPERSPNPNKANDDLITKRLANPKIKELFDRLDAPEAKRRAGAEKYRSDDKLIEVLTKRVAEADAEAAKKAAATTAAAGLAADGGIAQ